MMRTTLDYAKSYVSRGLSVIPLKQRGKIPAVAWQEYQTRYASDEELVEWFGNDEQHNIGIVTGRISGIAVVDVDGPEGRRTADRLGLESAPTVTTGNGYHLYFKHAEGVKNSHEKPGIPGIHVRGEGGYVVAPPSVHATGIEYRWLPDRGINELPLKDFPFAILSGDSYEKVPLEDLYEGVTEGSRNESLARLVGSWATCGGTYDSIIERALAWNELNTPPLPRQEVLRTVKSIYSRYEAEFEDLVSRATVADESDQHENCLVSAGSLILNAPEPVTWIVEGLLPEGSVTLLSAPAKNFKTTSALCLAACISSGQPFVGREVRQRPVIYVDKDNPQSVEVSYLRRLGCDHTCAIQIWNNFAPLEPPYFPDDAYRMLIKGRSVIFFDSFIRFLPKGIDENSATDMARMIRFLKTLTKAGATVVLLHHAGKAEESVYRGSSDILGGIDVAYKLRRNQERLTIHGVKSRYGPEPTINLLVTEAHGRVVFEDLADVEKREQEQEFLRIRQAITALGTANQTTLVAHFQGVFGRDSLIGMLQKGEGIYWRATKDGKAMIYTPLTPPQSLPTSPLSEKYLIEEF